MVYRITLEVGENTGGKFKQTSYDETYLFRYSLGRSIEHILNHMARNEDTKIADGVKPGNRNFDDGYMRGYDMGYESGYKYGYRAAMIEMGERGDENE